MSAQSPQAYFVSALIHGAAAGIISLLAFASQRVSHDNPKILELVAGAGDNYAATAAPALGSPGGSKIKVALPKDEPEPPQPAAQPSTAAEPITPAQPKSSKGPSPTRTPNFLADLKRIERKREARLEAAYKKKELAEEKRRKSLEQSGKDHPTKIDAEGIREGVVGGSTDNKTGGAGGKALTREERSLLEAYFALLKAKIKETHVPPDGVSDNLAAKVAFMVAADGSLSSVRIEKTSGNAEFDRSVIEAVKHTSSIGSRPDGRSEEVTMTFRMVEDEQP